MTRILKNASKKLDAGEDRTQLRSKATESRVRLVIALESVVMMFASKLRAAEEEAWSLQGSKAAGGINRYGQLAELSCQLTTFINEANKIQPTRDHVSIFELVGQKKSAKAKGQSIESLVEEEAPLVWQKEIAAIICYSTAQVSRFSKDVDFPKKKGAKYCLLEVIKWADGRKMEVDLARVRGLETKYLAYEEKVLALGHT